MNVPITMDRLQSLLIEAKKQGWTEGHESAADIVRTRAKYRLSDDLIGVRDDIDRQVNPYGVGER